jgi:hypothetical protein
VWESGSRNAELQLSALGGGRYHIEGFALWGRGRELGPHTGNVSFDTALTNGEATFEPPDSPYRLSLTFLPGLIIATEETPHAHLGMNVTFEGTYVRAA